jgi:P27 family predicted phage terminase small subunit
VIDGTRESRINRNAPLPAETAIVPPVELTDEAQRVWDRLAPDLIRTGVLSAWDVDLFAVYVDAVATYFECRAAMGSDLAITGSKGTAVKSPLWRIMRDCEHSMKSIGSRFGLTPSDRAGLDLTEDFGGKPTTGPERLLS